MTGSKTAEAWLQFVVFTLAGTLVLLGNLACLDDLLRTGRINVRESAEAPATFHYGIGAVLMLALGFLFAAAFFVAAAFSLGARKQ